MNVFKKSKLITRFFSLIELLIVVAIIGALVALILPHMEGNEQEARDTACDYNNYGTLRYLTMFRSVNGVYPKGFHTGLNTNGANAATVEGLAGFTAANMCGNTGTLTVGSVDDNMYSGTTAAKALSSYAASLKNAGIVSLCYGTGGVTEADVGDGASVYAVQLFSDGSWKEDQEITTAGVVTAGTNNDVTVNGKNIAAYADASTDTNPTAIIPLFVTPTIDWDNYYDNTGAAAGESTVKIALAGQCPNLTKGSFRYYICMFKAYADGSTAAKLIGTLCPECGSVNP